jgi:hypothetical protein
VSLALAPQDMVSPWPVTAGADDGAPWPRGGHTRRQWRSLALHVSTPSCVIRRTPASRATGRCAPSSFSPRKSLRVRRFPMQVEIVYRPAFSLAVVSLQPNERLRAEAGAHRQHVRWHRAGDQRRRRHHGGAQALAPRRRELFRQRLPGPAPRGHHLPGAPPAGRHVHASSCPARPSWSSPAPTSPPRKRSQIDTQVRRRQDLFRQRGAVFAALHRRRHPHPLELWRHPRGAARARPAPDGGHRAPRGV